MLKHHVVSPEKHNPLTWESVECIIDTKCRQCPVCLRKRRVHWWHRARSETNLAPRTWFATFTYTPDNHYKMLLTARQRCKRKGLDYEALSADQQFGHLVAVGGVDLTLFFKRVRKSARGPIRYLVVSEAHKSGLPHFHALIHEVSSGAVTYDLLKTNWRAGFSSFKLCDEKAPSYVAKYISKDARARVRASSHYGSDTSAYAIAASEALTERMRSASGAQQREKIVTGNELTRAPNTHKVV